MNAPEKNWTQTNEFKGPGSTGGVKDARTDN